MRILIATFTFPPNKDGVSEAATIMAEGFLERGWQVDIATTPISPVRDSHDWRGARIHEFSIQGSGHRKNPYKGELEAYREFVKGGGWDAIIIHSYSWPLTLILGHLDKIPAPKILVSHGYSALHWVRVPKFPWGLGALLRNILNSVRMCRWIHHFDRVVYLSKKADFAGFMDHRIAQIVNYRRRCVIPNGVDPLERGRDPEGFLHRHGIRRGGTVFLCVANYSRRKDQGYAARAFRRAAIPNSTLIFIGSEFNEHSQRFRAEDASRSDSAKVGEIVWLENLAREETLNAYAACDVFVLSANHEAQPFVLLETMREGKPWIARNAGCISEMPGGISVGSEWRMADAMAELAGRESLRTALGKEGMEAIKSTYNLRSYKDAYAILVTDLQERTDHPDQLREMGSNH